MLRLNCSESDASSKSDSGILKNDFNEIGSLRTWSIRCNSLETKRFYDSTPSKFD